MIDCCKVRRVYVDNAATATAGHLIESFGVYFHRKICVADLPLEMILLVMLTARLCSRLIANERFVMYVQHY